MQQLSQSGQQAIDDIAKRHGFSADAVLSMIESLIKGNGTMAQFNHREFAGSGQWMSGGMTMVSDMFNNHLKNRVNGLCTELARLLANQPDLLRSGSFQSQNQGNQQQNNYAGAQFQNGSAAMNPAGSPTASLFIPPASSTSADWWGPALRWPNSTGAQNGVRYAYFAQARRLAIQLNGKVTIYDTLDHQIEGFSQQQSYGGSISFNSQHGLIDVTSLPIVSVDGAAQAANTANGFGNVNSAASEFTPANAPTASVSFATSATSPLQRPGSAIPREVDIFLMIEKLADLRSRELISDEEFVTKKTELLARL